MVCGLFHSTSRPSHPCYRRSKPPFGTSTNFRKGTSPLETMVFHGFGLKMSSKPWLFGGFLLGYFPFFPYREDECWKFSLGLSSGASKAVLLLEPPSGCLLEPFLEQNAPICNRTCPKAPTQSVSRIEKPKLTALAQQTNHQNSNPTAP